MNWVWQLRHGLQPLTVSVDGAWKGRMFWPCTLVKLIISVNVSSNMGRRVRTLKVQGKDSPSHCRNHAFQGGDHLLMPNQWFPTLMNGNLATRSLTDVFCCRSTKYCRGNDDSVSCGSSSSLRSQSGDQSGVKRSNSSPRLFSEVFALGSSVAFRWAHVRSAVGEFKSHHIELINLRRLTCCSFFACPC